ncbi:SAM-dependent methyltransferase [Pseudonocardia sp. TRM90224]|uniref:SAM-dependent methyltransferase n=1 Tax=Pseudonocardia sp. TRM90224 TaxID=2812678 RepID=UPI001E302EB6|nr:class I SAM-dependent methyltransferase [Pseudonocardia sp. TRM90224]
MTTIQAATRPVARTEYERRSQADWDSKTDDPINLLLGQEDGLYHHHFGIGDYDASVLDLAEPEREAAILAEMHRMETAEVELILRGLRGLPSSARVMDGGSGRGGTSFMVNRRFGCSVVGMNFCRHHIAFAERIARERGWSKDVAFRFGNMVETGLEAGSFDAVVTNETTMYIDLDEGFREFSRLLRPGGRYVGVTWCANDAVATDSEAVRQIDEHYVCHIHRRSAYFAALAANGLSPISVTDHTSAAVPYWELREASQLRTGVEEPFLNGYASGELNYLVIVAEKLCH